MSQDGAPTEATEAMAQARSLLAQEGVTVAELAASLARLTLLRADIDALMEEFAPRFGRMGRE